jgi:uncharacterized protein (DUF1501 family)
MAITRRRFLSQSAITAVGLSFASPLLDLPAFAAARPKGASQGASRLASGNKVVVAINLSGGNDGLNTVVPLFQYDRYRELRPTLAIPQESVLTLGDAPGIGLNPALAALHTLYGEGKVAVFPGVGAPPNAYGLFDHEASQYLFQSADVTGSANTAVPSGWVGRWLDSVGEGLVAPGINFGGGNLLLRGRTREALAIDSIEAFQVQPSFDYEARSAAYDALMRMPAAAGGVGERNRQLRLQVIEQSAVVHERTAEYEPAAEYEDNPLAYSLGECAKLIAADLGVRALAVGFDGFDTHAGQNNGGGAGELGYHDYLLATVGNAIAAFYRDLAAHGHGSEVIVLVFSEFGRRPEENNDRGTDHGFGSVAFAVGDAVRGGVYGDHPSLDEAALVLDGNVDVTTDFRSIYATVLGDYLAADPAEILGAAFPSLGFIR